MAKYAMKRLPHEVVLVDGDYLLALFKDAKEAGKFEPGTLESLRVYSLALRLSRQDHCSAGAEYFSEKLQITKKTFYKALKLLERAGLFKRTQKGVKGTWRKFEIQESELWFPNVDLKKRDLPRYLYLPFPALFELSGKDFAFLSLLAHIAEKEKLGNPDARKSIMPPTWDFSTIGPKKLREKFDAIDRFKVRGCIVRLRKAGYLDRDTKIFRIDHRKAVEAFDKRRKGTAHNDLLRKRPYRLNQADDPQFAQWRAEYERDLYKLTGKGAKAKVKTDPAEEVSGYGYNPFSSNKRDINGAEGLAMLWDEKISEPSGGRKKLVEIFDELLDLGHIARDLEAVISAFKLRPDLWKETFPNANTLYPYLPLLACLLREKSKGQTLEFLRKADWLATVEPWRANNPNREAPDEMRAEVDKRAEERRLRLRKGLSAVE